MKESLNLEGGRQAEMPVKAIKRQTLNQKVYESIKASILSGDLTAGSKLYEVQMAKQLGVSATPVREAFRMLAMEGLVRIDPWKGAVVQQYSGQETLEVTQCRAALETLALELAFDKLGDAEFDAIEAMIESYQQVRGDVSGFVQISSDIHDIWLQRCGNTKLLALMNQLNDVLLHDRNVSASDEVRKQQIIEEHLIILQALRKGDLEGAKAALKQHIYNGYEFMKK